MAGRPLRRLRNAAHTNSKKLSVYQALKNEADEGYVRAAELWTPLQVASQRIKHDLSSPSDNLSVEEKRRLLDSVNKAKRALYRAYLAYDDIGAILLSSR